MPTAAKVLEILREEQFAELIALIKITPNLVNFEDPDSGFSLLQMVGIESAPNAKNRMLVEFIITHSDLNLNFKNRDGQTNIDEIITAASPDLLALAIKKPQIIFNKDQLTYFDAVTNLKAAEKFLLKEQQKDPNSKASISRAVKTQKLKEIVTMLREATITYAIANARADILTAMIEEPGVLFNKAKQLTYTDAKNALAAAEQVLTAEKAKDPKAKPALDAGLKVANLTEMVAMLRDASIKHAVKTDDANLFTQLEAAGAKPLDKLGKFGKEVYPNTLLTAANVNLSQWLNAKREQTAKLKADKPHGASPDILFANLKKAETALKTLHDAYHEGAVALLDKSVSGDLATLEKLKAMIAASVPGPSNTPGK